MNVRPGGVARLPADRASSFGLRPAKPDDVSASPRRNSSAKNVTITSRGKNSRKTNNDGKETGNYKTRDRGETKRKSEPKIMRTSRRVLVVGAVDVHPLILWRGPRAFVLLSMCGSPSNCRCFRDSSTVQEKLSPRRTPERHLATPPPGRRHHGRDAVLNSTSSSGHHRRKHLQRHNYCQLISCPQQKYKIFYWRERYDHVGIAGKWKST